jgi:NAD(P)-dependent dehydrogenase (short-subunit alcohol dehydrogenase family)
VQWQSAYGNRRYEPYETGYEKSKKGVAAGTAIAMLSIMNSPNKSVSGLPEPVESATPEASQPLRSDSVPLRDKVCLVTGGTRGIGRAIAKMLLAEGAAVTICGRRQESVDKTLAELHSETGGKVKGKAADVRKYDEIESLFKFIDSELGSLNVLVNNAGVGLFKPVAELSVEDWHSVIDTNLTGAFYCCREALFRFGINRGGDVVNIGSLAGKNAILGGAAYNASKFGLTGFSEAAMLDTRNDNVRVSYVMPGSVATEFGGTDSTDSGRNWKIWAEDIADIVRMLLLMPPRTLVSRVEVRPAKPKR